MDVIKVENMKIIKKLKKMLKVSDVDVDIFEDDTEEFFDGYLDD